MTALVDAVIALLVFVAFGLGARACHQTHARCAPGYYAEGVRPSGETTCRRAPLGLANDSPAPKESYPMAVVCTGGTRPIVVNAREIGCQRGGWPR